MRKEFKHVFDIMTSLCYVAEISTEINILTASPSTSQSKAPVLEVTLPWTPWTLSSQCQPLAAWLIEIMVWFRFFDVGSYNVHIYVGLFPTVIVCILK